MTRRKFTFYAYGSDIDAVADKVEGLGGAFVGRRSPGMQPRLFGRSDLAAGSHVLIAPAESVASLAPRNSSGKGWWVLNEGPDPVVEFIISRITGSTLHSGRFYYIPQYVDTETMEFVAKPEAVQHLAEELFTWARKWVRRVQGHSCGPEAAQAVREGCLQLAEPT